MSIIGPYNKTKLYHYRERMYFYEKICDGNNYSVKANQIREEYRAYYIKARREEIFNDRMWRTMSLGKKK